MRTNMTSFYVVVLLIAICRNSAVQSATHHYRPLRYTIPQPLIRAFSPQGLQVSIPHTPGIQLFAFQGNINKPLEGNEREVLDYEAADRDGERWVYNNSTVELHVGDKIYYTLYVVKDNLGYRLRHTVQEIKELLPLDDTSFASFPTTSTPPPTTLPPAAFPLAADCTICKNVVSNIMKELLDAEQEADSQREMNDILKELVKKHPQTSRTLVLDGVNVRDDELVVTVQAIINDKLHLSFKVSNVTRTKEGMAKFTVGTLEEKVEVIRAAKRELKGSKFRIVY